MPIEDKEFHRIYLPVARIVHRGSTGRSVVGPAGPGELVELLSEVSELKKQNIFDKLALVPIEAAWILSRLWEKTN